MAVSKRLRFEIFRRDNHTCRYCGRSASEAVITVDHVTPVALGGTDTPANLVTACSDCNSGKSSVASDAAHIEDVSQDALRWAAAIREATAQAMVDRDRRIAIEQDVYEAFGTLQVPSYRGGGTGADYLPMDWFESINRFLTHGLARGDLIDAAYIAIGATNVRPANLWRFFCGICWNIVRGRQATAATIIAAQEPPSGNPYAADEHYALMQFCELSLVCDGGF